MNIEKPIVENVVIADGENERTFVHCPENLEGEYTIPEGVTAIAPLAFKNCSQLESIVIPNSIRHIGHHAFEGCTAIVEIRIPIGINVIEEGTFMGCTNLIFVAIPPSVNRIEKDAFRGCSQLESGEYYYCYDYNLNAKEYISDNIIPSGVEFIGDNAFRECSNIEHFAIPYAVTTIGKNAFSDCRKLEEIQIFTSEVSIGKDVFSGCKSLNRIIAYSIAAIWPFLSTRERKGVDFEPMELDQMGFEDEVLQDLYSSDGTVLIRCSKRTTRYSIPNGVEEIAKNAFAGCALLEGVSIPKTITRIGDGAFSGCEQITSILLPDSIVSIGQNAFYGCKALNGIYIPNGSRDKFEKLLPKHLHDRLIELKAIHDKH